MLHLFILFEIKNLPHIQIIMTISDLYIFKVILLSYFQDVYKIKYTPEPSECWLCMWNLIIRNLARVKNKVSDWFTLYPVPVLIVIVYR